MENKLDYQIIENAKEALELTKKNGVSCKKLLEMISRSANVGGTFIQVFEYVSDEVKIELMKCGFKITFQKDFNGTDLLFIYW